MNSIRTRILKEEAGKTLYRVEVVSMNSIRTRILKDGQRSGAGRPARSFNEFDPNEDTESVDVPVQGEGIRRFNEFDPNEDTESSAVAGPYPARVARFQ